LEHLTLLFVKTTMKKLSIIFLLTISLNIYSQGYDFEKKIFGYSLDQITMITNDVDSTFYIDDLITKIFYPDSTVTDLEIALGYYGFVLQPDYKPDKYIGLELEVMQLNDNQQYKSAAKFADSLVTNNPTGLMGLVEYSYALHRLQDTVMSARYRKCYERLCDVIFKSGDGKSMETAYIITGLKDIEVLTQFKRMTITKRKTKSKKKQTFEIVNVFQSGKLKTLYFDTSLITEFR
jgi:hypothetical protein